MKVKIFSRTNKGIELTKEGEVFLGYARQVLEQADLLEETFAGKKGKQSLCAFRVSIILLR